MADEEDSSARIDRAMEEISEDVFVNGDNSVDLCDNIGVQKENGEDQVENGKCNSENNSLDINKKLPRKPSIVKRNRDPINNEGNDRVLQRKKTVSFSSMPSEKKSIATGKHLFLILH